MYKWVALSRNFIPGCELRRTIENALHNKGGTGLIGLNTIVNGKLGRNGQVLREA